MKYFLLPLTIGLLVLACTPVERHRTRTFGERLGQAQTANITLAMNTEQGTISALPDDSNNLFEARVDYFGDIEYTVSGSANKIILLRENIGSKTYVGDAQLRWGIQLSPVIPLDVALEVDAGQMTADLSELQVTGVEVNIDHGEVEVRLPASEEEIDINVLVNSGSLNLSIPDNVVLDIERISLDDGEVVLNIGENVGFIASVFVRDGDIAFEVGGRSAVQVNIVDIGEWTVSLPSDYTRMVQAEVNTEEGDNSTFDDNAPEQVSDVKDIDSGVWESPGFADAEQRLIINITMQDGKVVLR